MADSPPYRESKRDTVDDAGVGPDRGSSTSYPGTRRWVKVSGIIALALVLLVGAGIMLLTGVGGRHEPERHTGGDDGGAIKPDEKTTGVLEVPGARLYYDVRGEGPLVVAVPGRKGVADGYQNLARELSARYQVVTYDRRGFSRSRLVGAQDYDHRLVTDADDVRRLIEHLSDEPATVFGSSSGALVALEALTRHPAVVRTVIAHEPPAFRLPPDGEQWLAFFDNVYDTYRKSGVDPALKQFAEGTGITGRPPGPAASDEYSPFEAGNDLYWFERELRQYPRVELDVEALATHADRLILAGGRESKQNPTYQPNTVLAAKFGKSIVDLPGGHLGFLTHPTEFARELLDALGR
jgi:acetyltransferase/esterase